MGSLISFTPCSPTVRWSPYPPPQSKLTMDLPDQEAAVQRTTCSPLRRQPGQQDILFTLPALTVLLDIELRLVPVSAPAGPVCIVRRLHSVQFSGLQRGILLLRPAGLRRPGHRRGSNRHRPLRQKSSYKTTVQFYIGTATLQWWIKSYLPIVQLPGFRHLSSSKTIVKCFALLGEYSPMENYK